MKTASRLHIASRRVERRVYKELPGKGTVPERPLLASSSGISLPGGSIQKFGDAPAGTTFVDNGGPVIASPDVHIVFWGTEWVSANVPVPMNAVIASVQNILAGPYLKGIQQYRCSGTGQVNGITYVVDGDPPNPFNDGTVQQFIINLIDGQQIPEPDEDWPMFVAVFMPTYAVYGPGGLSGAHSSVTWSDYDVFDDDNDPVHLAWIGNGGSLASMTTTFSHELVEACTDPQTTRNPAWRQTPCTNPVACEIGDVCSSTFVLNGVTVQSYWSQTDNSCIVPTGSGWLRIGGFFPSANEVAAVSRTPDQLDLFIVGNDGAVYTSWWNPANGWSGFNDDWLYIGGFFPADAQIAVVSRNPDQLDLFIVGNDGRVYTSWWNPANGWSGARDNWLPIGGFFPPGAKIAAVSRNPDQLDVFVCGNDGVVYTSWWTAESGWSGFNNDWRPIGGYFPPGASVSAVSRNPNQLDVFICGNDGAIYTSWWASGFDWSGIANDWRSIGGYFAPGAPVCAVSRNPDQLDVFICGNDGAAYTSWWTAGYDWSGIANDWRYIGGFFPSGAKVSAVSRNTNQLDLFICGNDGVAYTSWWTAGSDWSGLNNTWSAIGGTFPPGAPIAAVTRNPNQLDLFVCGNDGAVYTEWWTAGSIWSALT